MKVRGILAVMVLGAAVMFAQSAAPAPAQDDKGMDHAACTRDKDAKAESMSCPRHKMGEASKMSCCKKDKAAKSEEKSGCCKKDKSAKAEEKGGCCKKDKTACDKKDAEKKS